MSSSGVAVAVAGDQSIGFNGGCQRRRSLFIIEVAVRDTEAELA